MQFLGRCQYINYSLSEQLMYVSAAYIIKFKTL